MWRRKGRKYDFFTFFWEVIARANVAIDFQDELTQPRWLKSEMEYEEYAFYNTFHPFQNKHQIHLHLQSVKVLWAFEKSKFIASWNG